MWFESKTALAARAILFNSIKPVEHLAFGFLGTENNILRKTTDEYCE